MVCKVSQGHSTTKGLYVALKTHCRLSVMFTKLIHSIGESVPLRSVPQMKITVKGTRRRVDGLQLEPMTKEMQCDFLSVHIPLSQVLIEFLMKYLN